MRTTSMFLVLVAFALAGCEGFGAYPGSMPMAGNDAGVAYLGDSGSMPRTETDAGTPGTDSGPRATVDAGSMPVMMPDAATHPTTGASCAEDSMPVACAHPTCSSAFMVCDGGVWSDCLPALAECLAHPDAGTDSGPPTCESRPTAPCT